jgi:threonine dehydratase
LRATKPKLAQDRRATRWKDDRVDFVTIKDINRAAQNIRGVAVRTPLLPTAWDLWLKPENLQPVGAFKIRGAYHAMASLDPVARARGVVTHSSGNHGRALAYAAAVMGVPAVIVMPKVAPPVKIAAIEALGAEIVLVEPDLRVTTTTEIAQARQLNVIPPFDHRDIIAGQGTIGVEILADLDTVDVVLVPVGGGGLASGVATAIKALRPETTVIGVEPELAADAKESLDTGRLIVWPADQTYRTSADGLRTNLSELTFAHLEQFLDGMVTVTEDDILRSVGLLAREANLVVEPSGAVASAAYLFHRDRLPAGTTVAVVSGGNLEVDLFAELVRRR